MQKETFDTLGGRRGVISVATVKKLLGESHRLVAEKLSKKVRQTLGL